jgi:hypothetical protein
VGSRVWLLFRTERQSRLFDVMSTMSECSCSGGIRPPNTAKTASFTARRLDCLKPQYLNSAMQSSISKYGLQALKLPSGKAHNHRNETPIWRTRRDDCRRCVYYFYSCDHASPWWCKRQLRRVNHLVDEVLANSTKNERERSAAVYVENSRLTATSGPIRRSHNFVSLSLAFSGCYG